MDRLERRYRDPATFGRIGWVLRMAGRNARWARDQGVRRLIEEHELNPVRQTSLRLHRAVWRSRHSLPPGSARAIFLCGAPRSGTNMIVRGIAALPEVAVFNEGDRRAFTRYRLRPDEDIRRLVLESKHEFVLFKPLLDSHRIAGLLDGLQTATPPRGLWAYRDVDGRARSALTKFGPSALIILRQLAAGEGLQRWQAQGISDDTLGMLREVPWDRMSPADGAALMWVVRNQLFFDLGLDGRADVLPVSYDAVVRDPDAALRLVSRHTGIPWRDSIAADVDERSRRVVRLELDSTVRDACDEMAARLDDAARAAAARLGG